MTRAGLIGLTVFTEYLNCAAAFQPIDGGSAKGGVVRAARSFPRAVPPKTPARTACEALQSSPASQATRFDHINHGGGSTAQEQ